MVTLEGTKMTSVYLFEIPLEIKTIKNITPSMILVKSETTTYIYNLLEMKLIYETEDPWPSVFPSPDGKILFRNGEDEYQAYSIIILTDIMRLAEVTPTKVRYVLRGKPGSTTRENLEEGQVIDKRPGMPLVILGEGNYYAMSDITKDGEIEMHSNVYSKKKCLQFKHPLNRPIATVVTWGLRWARIMSNNTLETHLTWPKGVSLDNPRLAFQAAREAVGNPIAVAWFSCNRSVESEKEALPASEAVGIYLQRLTYAIAVAVGLFQ